MRALALLLVAATLLAPLAAAQVPGGAGVVRSQLSVSVEDPGRALQPGRMEGIVVLLSYSWSLGAQPAAGSDPTSETNATQRTRVHLAVKSLPSWVANATFEQETVELPVNGPGSGTSAAAVNLILGIDPRAPALQREPILVTATADPNGNVAGATGESPEVKLRAAIVARLNVTAEPAQVVPGGRWTAMPFTVTNQGNTELKVKLNVTARPQDSQVEYPETVTLPRDASQVVEVRLRVPWTTAESGIVELEAVPLLDDEEGKPARASIDVVGTSAVPGAAPLLALLAAAVLARSRRR